MTATIKEQLHKDIVLGTTDPDELGKRNGLNGHDLVKNLEQLRKEGKVTLKWGRGEGGERITSVGLPKQRSVEDRVYNWLAGRNVMGAWIDVTPRQLNDELGLVTNAAGVAISIMLKTGKIEARKTGNRITALRIPLKLHSEPRPEVVVVDEATGSVAVTSSVNGSTNGASSELPAPTPIRPTMPPTPMLDAYFSARRIARLAPDHNPFISVDFTEVELAEEALVLRERLARALGL